MSINLGSEAIAAIKELRNDERFTAIRAGLREAASRAMHMALASDPALRVDQTAYARAMSDTWVAIEAAATDTQVRQVKKPEARNV